MVGFSPHRDRQPDEEEEPKKGMTGGDIVKRSFHKDGQAKYVTMWMALTDATPENSCLYVLPKKFDPGYSAGDNNSDDDDDKSDPLSRALPTKESYQNIRALPRPSGQSVLFTHRILHWGSKGNENSSSEGLTPRIAISFVSSDPTFERPYLSSASLKRDSQCPTNEESQHQHDQFLSPPPFRIRLLLVCAQLLIYHQRFNLSKECVRACYDYCKEHAEDHLDEAYRRKVFVEFVKAMKEWDEKEAAEKKNNSKTDCTKSSSKPNKKRRHEEENNKPKRTLALTAVINKKMSNMGGKIE
eukprot:7119869-Ditylum_brightwellii.AAC.1